MSTATVPTKSVTADRFGAQHVVVIGSGLAGLTTALRLRRGGARSRGHARARSGEPPQQQDAEQQQEDHRDYGRDEPSPGEERGQSRGAHGPPLGRSRRIERRPRSCMPRIRDGP